MDYKYVRIQGKELAANTKYAKGIFSMCWKLVQDSVMDDEDAELFKEIDDWFRYELPFPEPCKRRENVVCFFKTENADLMLKMIKPALWLLDKYNHPYFVVYTNTPGEIVYEDKYQVAVKTDMNIIIEDITESYLPYEQD